ncbi:AfsR/SARP family transcriptional regulator [Saccharothrix australiensis]|uniref:DNA-binding SARP family transcriptional activator n=1 Tax=Saccharothrix australiensis TaxID=2072 RepID=A0A495W313_9PSEU|nr:BTAD domain-containing putative transcriptional regulator [Saccharothrix australiensis]RKT55145.1 DNA-binding SARP family transcriptional activator [Saccharothrix australiensis]
MQFCVLGPLAVRAADARRVPSAMMPQRLLALLLLNANRVVSTATIVDELWGGEPSKRVRQTVQTYVYQLRRALGGDAGVLLETHPRGYLIRLADGLLDLWRFEDLAARGQRALRDGDAEGAARLLSEALGLWSGTPLDGLPLGPVLEARKVQLTDRRLVVLEQRIDADLAAGEDRVLLPELGALLAEHPTHEGFTAQFMTAAHRCGRRGEALDAYGRLRRLLVAELGLEPSARLQALHRALLADDPAGTSTARDRVVPAQLPFDIGDFVGRRDALDAAVTALRVGEPRRAVPLVAVIGQAGVGKTAFAVRLGHRVREAFPDGQLVAALHDGLDRPVDPAHVLRSFLLALGVPEARQPADAVDRTRLFRSLVADRGLLVVLDDAASVEQVLPLLPAGPGCAAVLTSRVRLRGLPVGSTVELGPLRTDDGVALLSAVLGPARVAAEHDQARRVVGLCDALPVAVRIAAEKLLSRPVWPLRKFADRLADESRRLAELRTGALDLRDRLASACGRLGPSDGRALPVLCAAFGGDRFDLAATARVLAAPEAEVEALAESLVDAHLLRIVGVQPSGTAWFRFPDLVRLHAVDVDDTARPHLVG